MCHGVFDVVHPGHVRHLLYAKSKADILVASITADKHITKGCAPAARDAGSACGQSRRVRNGRLCRDRPQRQAAGESSRPSSPTISPRDLNTTPRALSPNTAEEAKIVEAYGGEIIFTPGDIVYSSSALIKLAPPSVKLETLQILMERQRYYVRSTARGSRSNGVVSTFML